MSISVIQWNSLQFGRSFMVEPRTEHQHQNDQRLWRNTKQKKTKTKKEKKNNKNLPANISASRSWLRCVLAILVIFTNALRIAMAGLGWVSAATRDKIKVIIFEILFDVCICGMLMFCVDLKNTEYINNNQIYFIIIIKERNRRTKRGQIMQTPHAGDLCCELMGPRQQHANRNAMQSIYIYIYFWMTSDPIDNTRNMSALIWWRLDGWIAQVCNHQKIEKKMNKKWFHRIYWIEFSLFFAQVIFDANVTAELPHLNIHWLRLHLLYTYTNRTAMRCAYKNRNHIIRRSLVSFSGRIVPAIDDGWSFWAAIVLGQCNTADHSSWFLLCSSTQSASTAISIKEALIRL